MAGHSGDQDLPHQPVLYQEIIHVLRPHSPGLYVDCTVGAGGHAFGLLEASSPNGHLIGIDLDPTAIHLAGDRLKRFGDRVHLVKGPYSQLTPILSNLGWDQVDGILIDLGLSSMQLAEPERGFSFQTDGPLDMRFDPDQTISAKSLVNDLPEKSLADIIYQYGEERHSRKLAKVIVKSRPITTTKQLADLIVRTIGGRRTKIHPATRTFQALRIAVNQELDRLEKVLPQALTALAPGGRIAVIAFHSLEDRLVKRFFKRESQDCLCPPEQPVCTCRHRATLRIVTRKPLRPSQAEERLNPRARSARLRVAEKIVP